jgi:hypothetical protein
LAQEMIDQVEGTVRAQSVKVTGLAPHHSS